jgi:hypothetical protein
VSGSNTFENRHPRLEKEVTFMQLTLQENAFTVDGHVITGFLKWENRVPYHECIRKVRELRKRVPKANFPSNVLLDDIYLHPWNERDRGILKRFMTDYMTTPCKEWIAYGSKDGVLKSTTLRYCVDRWDVVMDGIPTDAMDRYNAEIEQGRNAALFIEAYNDGLPVVEKGLFKRKRIVITPDKGGIVLIANFLRDNAAQGELHDRTRMVVRVNNPDQLPVARMRAIYVTSRDSPYVGPVSRNYGRMLTIMACDGPCWQIGILTTE